MCTGRGSASTLGRVWLYPPTPDILPPPDTLQQDTLPPPIPYPQPLHERTWGQRYPIAPPLREETDACENITFLCGR